MEFFQTLDPLLRTLWFIALPVSLIFIVQVIMTFIGMDATDGINADFSGDVSASDHGSFQLLSFRNMINFLLSFSWSGITLYNSIGNTTVLIFVSFLIGAAFVALFFFVMQALHKMSEDNTFRLNNAVGKTASVYITIPADKKGTGKVQVSVNGTIHEIDAITEHEKIESGTMVRINEIINSNILVVEKL
ncbi:MAG TPA: NfeD family protein [Bacteroidales bacterium]|nr:NfeD family protein [Bacteroidales bacterium]